MKKLGWKAIGFTLWLFGMFQLITLPLYMMSQPNTVEFNLGVALLVLVVGSMVYALTRLIKVGIDYVKYLETKNQE